MVAEKSNRRLFEERDPGSGRRGEEGTGSWDKWDEAAARSAKKEKVKTELPADVSIDDFRAFMPTHTYIYLPLRDFWPAASVNARVPLVGTGQYDEDGEEITIKASTWLDQNWPCEQMSWLPGYPSIVRDFITQEGEMIPSPGHTLFNTYRPPIIAPGDASLAKPWLDHIERIYPNDIGHIVKWCAQRVQTPNVKLNHALVLGGNFGIGKDTLLEPVVRAVGSWNCHEISPTTLLGTFTAFNKSVILRISEAHDLGELNIYSFYEHSKAIIATPPNVLRVNAKFVPEYHIPNIVGVVITTNFKTNGMFLPPDDRRHYVAWSDHPGVRDPGGLPTSYFDRLWTWIENGGAGHVAAFLRDYDLSGFSPKAPPPLTDAFFAICSANTSAENSELADALDEIAERERKAGRGELIAFTKAMLLRVAGPNLHEWLFSKASRRQFPARLEKLGFIQVRNPDAQDGLWKIQQWKCVGAGKIARWEPIEGKGQRAAIYGSQRVAVRAQYEAAARLQKCDRWDDEEEFP